MAQVVSADHLVAPRRPLLLPPLGPPVEQHLGARGSVRPGSLHDDGRLRQLEGHQPDVAEDPSPRRDDAGGVANPGNVLGADGRRDEDASIQFRGLPPGSVKERESRGPAGRRHRRGQDALVGSQARHRIDVGRGEDGPHGREVLIPPGRRSIRTGSQVVVGAKRASEPLGVQLRAPGPRGITLRAGLVEHATSGRERQPDDALAVPENEEADRARSGGEDRGLDGVALDAPGGVEPRLALDASRQAGHRQGGAERRAALVQRLRHARRLVLPPEEIAAERAQSLPPPPGPRPDAPPPREGAAASGRASADPIPRGAEEPRRPAMPGPVAPIVQEPLGEGRCRHAGEAIPVGAAPVPGDLARPGRVRLDGGQDLAACRRSTPRARATRPSGRRTRPTPTRPPTVSLPDSRGRRSASRCPSGRAGGRRARRPCARCPRGRRRAPCRTGRAAGDPPSTRRSRARAGPAGCPAGSGRDAGPARTGSPRSTRGQSCRPGTAVRGRCARTPGGSGTGRRSRTRCRSPAPSPRGASSRAGAGARRNRRAPRPGREGRRSSRQRGSNSR